MTAWIGALESFLTTYLLVYVLIGLGLYFTIGTRFVQFRHFGSAWRHLLKSRHREGQSLTSFQAFTVGLAGRVGTGNIAGVALALTIGGPGALFWMWMVALVGMATSFVESTLAQIYKVEWGDGIFRGGPSYYLQRGLKSRGWGIIFAVLLVFSYGLIFPMVQSNTIAVQLAETASFPVWASALILGLISIPILFKGLRLVARLTEIIVPVMAVVYLTAAAIIIVANYAALPQVFNDIFAGAFGLKASLAGTGGGIAATLLNGVKRGLFSNEAGQGSSPNGAATADIAHPVTQGFIQSLGVFFDTILVCSATGFMILLAAPSVYTPGQDYAGAVLAQDALSFHLDNGIGWATYFMTFIVILFAYSSILGYYTFSSINLDYLGLGPQVASAIKLAMVGAIVAGALQPFETAWMAADLALVVMTLINMVGAALLAPMAFAALRDYDRQTRAGVDQPVFIASNARLPRPVPGTVWSGQRMQHFT